MRRIKAIGNPILIGQVGIEPSRGEDWTVYDLMISQLPATVKLFRAPRRARGSESSGVRAGHSRRPARGARNGCRRLLCRLGFARPSAADRAAGSGRRTLRSQTVGKPSAGAARLLAAAPLLPGRSLGCRHVSGAAALAHHAQLAYRSGRPGSRKHAAVRGDRRRHLSADRLQGQSAHAVRAGSRGRGLALDRRMPEADRALSCDDDGRAEIARAGQARTMAQHTYRHRAAEILGFVEGARAPR